MRIILIELSTDSEEPLDVIAGDLKMEISCCVENYEFRNIYEGEEDL